MAYYADTNVGVVKVTEQDGTILVSRDGLVVHRTQHLESLTHWLTFHKASKLRATR